MSGKRNTPTDRKALLDHRRENRQNMTLAESIIWGHLRAHRLGVQFRRQHPFLNYIVDFYCPEVDLIIEIDGVTHSTPEEISYDRYRQSRLEALGYIVVRYTNEQVIQTQEVVVESIREKVAELRAAKAARKMQVKQTHPL
jgi:very-short-patch-repair endonuclease